jgi:NADPH-dependent 2,4-dienoyl-CoA reductase/sulfur reductase-like enzyme
VQDLHEEHGVEVLTGAGVTGFLGSSDVEGVLLDDARVVPADLVLVAIGADPETSWLDGAGLTIDRGVVCDATLSAAPGVVAAGDLVRFPHPLAESSVRLEHWTNAAEQGAHAVRTLLADPGAAEAFSPVPYFWSDQFDVRIQAIGLPDPGDEVIVVDGSLESRRFVSVHGREGRLVAALAFGRPRQLMSLRPLIARGARLEEATALLR